MNIKTKIAYRIIRAASWIFTKLLHGQSLFSVQILHVSYIFDQQATAGTIYSVLKSEHEALQELSISSAFSEYSIAAL